MLVGYMYFKSFFNGAIITIVYCVLHVCITGFHSSLVDIMGIHVYYSTDCC